MACTTRNAVTEAVATADPRRTERTGRSSRLGADFETFTSTLRRALVSVSPLEDVLADRVILAAWRLQLASAVEFETAFSGEELLPISRKTTDAEQSMGKALELLEASRAARLGGDDRPAREPADCDEDGYEPAADDFTEADFSNEWPTLPDDAHDPAPADGSAIAPRWQDRLVFDFNVSENSPVVKGTWVTVGHVVSLIVDGWNWSDVLRTHPELTEDDIRTCLAYTVDQDNSGGF